MVELQIASDLHIEYKNDDIPDFITLKPIFMKMVQKYIPGTLKF